MALIYFIRHGQASFLKRDYDQLSELGKTQSLTLGEALKSRNIVPVQVAGGSLKRHLQTATHCLQAIKDTPAAYSENDVWNEYNHMELLSAYDPRYADFQALSDHVAAHPNPGKAIQLLLNAALKDWISNRLTIRRQWKTFKEEIWTATHDWGANLKGDDVGWVFTSGGPISAIMMQLLKLKDEQFIELQGKLVNTSVTKIRVSKSGLSLSTYNDFSHLDHRPDWITYR